MPTCVYMYVHIKILLYFTLKYYKNLLVITKINYFSDEFNHFGILFFFSFNNSLLVVDVLNADLLFVTLFIFTSSFIVLVS